MAEVENRKKGKLAKVIITLTFIGVLIATALGYEKYQAIFGPNVPKSLTNPFVEIPTNSSFEEVVTLLKGQGFIQNDASFKWVSELMKYPRSKMRAGRFKIKEGWSNRKLIQHLRSGEQATVKLVVNNAWTVDNVAARVASFIEPDSVELSMLFKDSQYLDSLGNYTTTDLMTLFIPNTYDFFWNTSATQFMERMVKENKHFWESKNRLEKAEKLELTPKEVYILASIVERETLNDDEKPRMAGVYYNRLKTDGWKLEADPTVKFASGDFGLKRILNKHLEIDSPYNTYKYPGLPPGPISMASITSIDAVLNLEDHRYMFFCARGDGSGYHNFAKTLAQHNRNAATYRANMRKNGFW